MSSDCQCQSRTYGFNPSVLGHSGICGAADDAEPEVSTMKRNIEKYFNVLKICNSALGYKGLSPAVEQIAKQEIL
jgi:hypothetical protein